MAKSDDEWVGKRLASGRYTVRAKLGEGGMGFVLHAHDEKLNTDVVIKAPHRHLLRDSDFAERFSREVRSLVKLSHPHIVKITDVDEDDGMPLAVMQHLGGGSLQDRREANPSEFAKAIRSPSAFNWLLNIADALDFVHRQGYVHRDVKPANILFDDHANSYLSDFGVAKVLADAGSREGSAALTGTGLVVGTPEYMAPELVLGEAFDGRADQYALAITVFEVLSGQRPITGTNASAALVAQTTQAPRDLSEFVSAAPPELCKAIHKALSKSPLDRFPNCKAFARAVVIAVQNAANSGVGNETRTTCPVCQKGLRITAVARGKTIPCPGCDTMLRISDDLRQVAVAEKPGAAKERDTDSYSVAPSSPDSRPGQTVAAVRSLGSRAVTSNTQVENQTKRDTSTVSRPKVQLAAATAADKNGRHRSPYVLFGAAAGGAAVFLGIIIYVATNNGTIKISLSDAKAAIELKIDGEKVVFADPNQPITLRAGKHGLEVISSQFETVTQEFTIRRGENPPIQISLMPKPVIAALEKTQPKPPTAKPVLATPSSTPSTTSPAIADSDNKYRKLLLSQFDQVPKQVETKVLESLQGISTQRDFEISGQPSTLTMNPNVKATVKVSPAPSANKPRILEGALDLTVAVSLTIRTNSIVTGTSVSMGTFACPVYFQDGVDKWTTDIPSEEISKATPDFMAGLSKTLETLLIEHERKVTVSGVTGDSGKSVKYFYVADESAGGIFRATADGIQIEKIASAESPRGLAVDSKNRKLYWVNHSKGTISRANLDGSSSEEIVSGETGGDFNSVVVDTVGQRLYWQRNNGIRTSLLDGRDKADFLTRSQLGHDCFQAVGIDTTRRKLFWVGRSGTKLLIVSCSIDNPAPVILAEAGEANSTGGYMAVDTRNQKLYWTVGRETTGQIMSIACDGKGMSQFLAVDRGQPNGIAVDEVNQRLYWGTIDGNRVEQIGLDGNGRRATAGQGLSRLPRGIGVLYEGNSDESPGASTNPVGESEQLFTPKEGLPIIRKPLATIDLMPRINLGVHAHSNNVKLVDKSVVVGSQSALSIPFSSTGDYELEIGFVRTSGSDALVGLFPIGNGHFNFGLSQENGRQHTVMSGAHQPGTLINGKSYTVTIRVKHKGQSGEVELVLDGQSIVTTRIAILPADQEWAGIQKAWVPAIKSQNATYEIRSITLKQL